MTKYNINIKNLNGDNNHIGDKIIFNTPQEFLKNHEEVPFTEVEKELVKVIYANTDSDEERWGLLESIKAIQHEEDIDEEEKQKSILSFKPLLKMLKNTGKTLAYKIVVSYFTEIDALDKIREWVK